MDKNILETRRCKPSESIISWMIICLYSIEILAMVHVSIFSIYSKPIVTLFILSFLTIALIMLRCVKIKYAYLILSMLFYDLLSMVITDGGGGSIMIQYYIIITVIALSNCHFNQRKMKLILTVVLILWVSWILRGKGYFYAFNRGEREMNSNTIAEILLFSYMFFSIYQKGIGRRIANNKYILFFFTILTAWGLWQCRSRTTIVAFMFYLALCFVVSSKIWCKETIIAVTGALMLAGVIFPLVYLSLGKYQVLHKWVYQVTGRSLYTGRETLWKGYYDGFGNSAITWLFGQGSHTDSITHIHNAYLLVMLNFGIIGVALFMWYVLINVVGIVQTTRGEHISEIQLKSVFMFWCFLLIGWAETSLLWSPMIPFCYMSLALGQNESIKRLYRNRI